MKFLALLLIVASFGAWGQSVNSTSNSGSNAASTANQGNAQDITFNSIPGPAVTTVRAAPAVTLPAIGMTATCMIGASGGASGLGFGVAIGGGIEDKECTLRETARLLYSIGQGDAAVRLLCNNSMAAKALGDALCAVPAPKMMGCFIDAAYATKMGMPVCKQPY